MTRFAVATWCSPLSTPADFAGAVLAVAANRFLFNNEVRASAPRLVVLRARKARRQIRFSASTGRLMQTMIPEIPQRGSHKNEQSPTVHGPNPHPIFEVSATHEPILKRAQ